MRAVAACVGLILVHDVTNRKSSYNLRRWMHEVERAVGGELAVPLLVAGTKQDLLQAPAAAVRRVALAEEYDCPTVTVVRRAPVAPTAAAPRLYPWLRVLC
jgi:GTPase SAR1 family protein